MSLNCFVGSISKAQDKSNYSLATGSSGTSSSNINYSSLVFNTPQSYNLFNYFSNLTENLGDNPTDNCVSVACGMIASYYDTYFNDSIIPEIYDVPSECINYDFDYYHTESSPGVFSQLPVDCLYSDYTINYQKYNQYLANYNDFVYEIIGVDISNDMFSPVYHYNTMGPLAGAIVNRLNNISSSSFSFDVGYGNDLDDCKEAIDNGYPVFVRILNGSIDHAVVAFAYDENDNLYYHMGYKLNNNYGMVMIDNMYQHWAFVVSPADGYSHVCSNNYYSVNDGVITYYCPCMLNGMSYPNHNHNIVHSHGYYFDEDDELINTSLHYESCSSCNLSKTYDCGITSIAGGNDNHAIEYGCGAIQIESHHVVDFECMGTDIHLLYCICGSLYSEHHDFCIPVLINGYIEYVCICGLRSFDHDEEWREELREYLQDHDYFDEDFFDELLGNT